MGSSMAANLARAGFAVTGWNRTKGRITVQAAVDGGVTVCDDLTQAVQDADAILLCLSDTKDIEDMLLSHDFLKGKISSGSIVIDMSTTGPECAKKLAAALLEDKIQFVDAPVSGGDIGARNGTLTIMVGAEKADFDRCLPLFQAMGNNITHCGNVGAGQAVKLCNQVLCAVNMVAVCEALSLAQQLDIDPKLVVDVCSTGAAGSWALANLGPRILSGDLAPAFKIKDMQKDLRLVGESHAGLPGVKLANDKFGDVVVREGTAGSALGTQAMIKAYAE